MGQKLTGYPSIDRPWMKYYTQSREHFQYMGLYQYLKEKNKDNLDNDAMMYFGNKYTFRQMFDYIDVLSQIFLDEGVKANDKVIVLALNTPDTICSIYALNKIGAIGCMEYITQTEESLGKITRQYSAEYAIVIDVVYKKYKDVLMKNGVKKIFFSGVSDSMPAFLKLASKLKSKKLCDISCVILNKRIKKTQKSSWSYDWKGSETAIILSTSGTTGVPKRAELSCNAINSLAYQGQYVDFDFRPGKRFLTPAPPFLAFGISLTVHLPLCNGVCLILSVKPDPDFVAEQFIKYKPNMFICGSVFMDRIIANKKVQKMDLSFVTAVELGGEAVSTDYIKELNQFFKEHNSNSKAFTGYGMTELAGCSTTESISVIRSGSVGIPLCDVNFKIVDVEGIELPYDCEGEVCINSPCMMNGYYLNKKATDEIIEMDQSGTRWIHTGDMGKIDKDGFVYIVGRIKRLAVTIDPVENLQVKLFPDYIEQILNENENVERCAVITVPSEERFNVPVAFVKLHKYCEEDANKLDAFLMERVEEYCKPVKYYFISDIPFLPNGKIDYQSLDKILKER